MRLYSFRIRNFKSIIDTGEVKVSEGDNITILAGQNEAGKSSILEALKFFEDGEFSELNRSNDKHPMVEVAFGLSSDEEYNYIAKIGSEELANHIKKNKLRMFRGSVDNDDYDAIEPCATVFPKKIIDDIEVSQKETGPSDRFSKDKVLEMRPRFIFYGTFSEDVLPDKIKQSEISLNQSVKDFEKVFDINFSELLGDMNETRRRHKLNILNKRASDNLNTYWSQDITGEDVKYKFEIDANVQEPSSYSGAESIIIFMISQDESMPPLYFAQKSKGFRWFSNFNLRLRAHKVSADNLANFILLIDEPGEGLHEVAQRDAKRILNEIGSRGAQIIFSTHQAQMIKEGDGGVKLSRIKLITKAVKKGTKIRSISQATGQQDFKDALSPVRTAMGLVTVDVSSTLEGKTCVVCEGITDSYFLGAFLKLYDEADAVSLIPCVGASQVSNVFSILCGWGVKAKVVVDDDSAGGKAIREIEKILSDEDISAVLKKNKGCSGIEDSISRGDFVKLFGDYLEDRTDKKSNSDKAVINGKKEIIGREFLDRVESGEINLSSFDSSTKAKIKDLVGFMTNA
mgnify:FL=1